jgi:hypothetical protein
MNTRQELDVVEIILPVEFSEFDGWFICIIHTFKAVISAVPLSQVEEELLSMKSMIPHTTNVDSSVFDDMRKSSERIYNHFDIHLHDKLDWLWDNKLTELYTVEPCAGGTRLIVGKLLPFV